MGGAEPLRQLIDRFYQKVPADPILAPVFAHMSPEHFQHVAQFIGEVLGGPSDYSTHHGGHAEMIRHHLNRHITDQQRQRWMNCYSKQPTKCGSPLIPSFVQPSLPISSGVLVLPLSIPASLPRLLLSTLLCLLGVGVSPAALTSPQRTRNNVTPELFFGACETVYANRRRRRPQR
ncbi:group II truncated hemoglobin [Edaphobacter aggregans]|uniref:group II truncated hemoglobin n=1 Tax=Edaphobacter aggregans TaxID=570835 RepID=UPI001C8B703F